MINATHHKPNFNYKHLAYLVVKEIVVWLYLFATILKVVDGLVKMQAKKFMQFAKTQAKKLMQFACVKMDFVTYLINSQPKKMVQICLKQLWIALRHFQTKNVPFCVHSSQMDSQTKVIQQIAILKQGIVLLGQNKGLCDTVALPFYINKYIKAKEELWKFKYFTMKKYNLQQKKKIP
jgi:hypothetical protein